MMRAGVRKGSALARSVEPRLRFAVRPAIVSQPIRWAWSSRYTGTPSRNLHTSSQFQWPAAAAAQHNDPSSAQGPEDKPITQFGELADRQLVDKGIINAITRGMKISEMTEVQRLTIPEMLKGIDTLAQAKTGTGKTLAFLIPVIQKILQDASIYSPNGQIAKPNAKDIRAVIVSPTRELAEQIGLEAQKVLGHTRLVVDVAVGGVRKQESLLRLRRQGCHILVGTPGRLIDILSDPYSGVAAPNLSSYVLDEADRLLDIGFAPDIERMQEYLPPRATVDRQTLLFSATVPHEVMDVVSKTTKPNFNFVQTVREDEVPTHLSVPQKAVILRGLENQLAAILELAKQAIDSHRANPSENRPFKAIVYFNSTAEVALNTAIFESLLMGRSQGFARSLRGLHITQMHAKLRQNQRTRCSFDFKRANSAILFSSDVTARGMDFPDVTHVIQVGTPPDRDTYIHRLGRTARANKTGEGWLFASETDYRSSMGKFRNLPIKDDDTSIPCASIDMAAPETQSPEIATTLKELSFACGHVDTGLKEDAFRACMNFVLNQRNKQAALTLVQNLATYGWGMTELPPVPSKLAMEIEGRQRGGFDQRRSRPRSSFPPRSSSEQYGFSQGQFPRSREQRSRPSNHFSPMRKPTDRRSGGRAGQRPPFRY